MAYLIVSTQQGYLNRPRKNSIHLFTKNIADATLITNLDEARSLARIYRACVWEKGEDGKFKMLEE